MALDDGIAYLKANPKIAVAGGIAVGGVVLFLALKRGNSPTGSSVQGTSQGALAGSDVTNPLGGQQAGTIAGVSYVDRVTEIPKVPAKGILQAVRLKADGSTYISTYRKAVDPTRSCGPGYQLVVQSSGAIRCAAIDERDVKNKGQLTEAPKLLGATKAAGEGWETTSGIASWDFRGPSAHDLRFAALNYGETLRARGAFSPN